MPFDDELLQDYMSRFYGFGNYAGAWWFIGMEEGGGDVEEAVTERLNRWNARGRRELEDVDIFNGLPAEEKWFTPRPPLQRTWAGLIRLMLSASGVSPTVDEIRAYQGQRLGRLHGDNCILELLPLPSPSIQHWLYGERSGLVALKDRETYRAAVAPQRIAHIRARIAEYHPHAVVFYSHQYREHWERIVGSSFEPSELDGLLLARDEQTVFAMTRHPTYRGLTSAHFDRAGEIVAEYINELRRPS